MALKIPLQCENQLIESIEALYNGEMKPYRKTEKRGRPAKFSNYEELKEHVKNSQLNKDCFSDTVNNYMQFFAELKNFNIKMNILIDRFLEDIKTNEKI